MNRAGEWSLAPAFDLLPTLPGGDRQALGVGPRGAARDIANIIAGAALLGLDQREARKMVGDTNAAITGRLPALLHEAGLSHGDSPERRTVGKGCGRTGRSQGEPDN